MMQLFMSFPLFIQAALIIITLSLLGWVVTLINLLYNRWKGNREDQERRDTEPLFQELFLHHIFLPKTEELQPNVLQEFKMKYLGRKRVRRRLVADMLHYQQLFSGTIGSRMEQLYVSLELHKDSLKYLKSRKPKKLLLALNEFLNMHLLLTDIDLEGLQKHKHPLVREIARRYILKMTPNDPFQIFTNLDEPLSKREQIELFKVITEMEYRKLPNFAMWIQADRQPSLISLCLKLAVYFQQYDSIPVITRLLELEDAQIRKEAINALGKLHQDKAERTLVALYDHEEEDVKIEILKALGRINSGHYLNLLKQACEQEESIALRKHAAHSIYNHRERGQEVWDTLRSKEDPEIQTVLNHAANKLIRY